MTAPWQNHALQRTRHGMKADGICLLVFLAALFLAGCQTQSQPHDHASEAEIRQFIVGTWLAEDFEGGGPLTLTFCGDGSVEIQHPSSPAGRAAWRIDERCDSCLLVTSKKDELASNSLDFWHVSRVDDHELSVIRGFSTAGLPERLTRLR